MRSGGGAGMLSRLPVVVLTTLVAITLQAPQHAGAHAMRNHRYKWVDAADHHVYVRMGVQTCSEDRYYIRVHNDRNAPVELDWLLHTPENPKFDSAGGGAEIPARTPKTLPNIFVHDQVGTRLVARVRAHGTRYVRIHLQGPGPCPG